VIQDPAGFENVMKVFEPLIQQSQDQSNENEE
jgi:hypothetical protein